MCSVRKIENMCAMWKGSKSKLEVLTLCDRIQQILSLFLYSDGLCLVLVYRLSKSVYVISAPQTWNPQEHLFGLRIDAAPRQSDPLPVGVGAGELSVAPRVAPHRVEHPPAEGPEGAEAAADAAAAAADQGRIGSGGGGEQQLEVGVGDAELLQECHADVALLRLSLHVCGKLNVLRRDHWGIFAYVGVFLEIHIVGPELLRLGGKNI